MAVNYVGGNVQVLQMVILFNKICKSSQNVKPNRLQLNQIAKTDKREHKKLF